MASTTIKLRPVPPAVALKDRVYRALRGAITSMDVYAGEEPPKLDERRLAEDLGVSRTPVREALSRLEQEGLVRTVPRKGAFVVRKTKGEILEIIPVWAALESMAARLATLNARAEEIAQLRSMFMTFEGPDGARAQIDEYSDTNIRFHQAIIALSKSDLLARMADPALRAHERDPSADHYGARPGGTVDHRSHAHHRGDREARYRALGATRPRAQLRAG